MKAPIRLSKIIILGLAVAALSSTGCADKRPVDRDAMIKFAASKRTDAELRALYAQAQAESNRLIAAGKAEREAKQRERDESFAKCQVDVAYRTRNPDACKPAPFQIPMPLAMVFSPQEMYERSLLGACEYVVTVGEAHQQGCLPPEH